MKCNMILELFYYNKNVQRKSSDNHITHKVSGTTLIKMNLEILQ